MSSVESEVSLDPSPLRSPQTSSTAPASAATTKAGDNQRASSNGKPPNPTGLKQDITSPANSRPTTPLAAGRKKTPTAQTDDALNMMDRNGSVDDKSPSTTPFLPKTEDPGKGHPERKRRASNESLDSSTTKASETAEDGKDDEDDDDNDEDDVKLHSYNPERLKAFNMFVRLFVDENLDRLVPISKQPKDKIQAILEACDRQFPEFHERSRKRIRTYLKSCRRMRRSKEIGWEQLRPTPPHLTSAAAEGILANACENESTNAKRMRMGLEPLPVNGNIGGSQNNLPTLVSSPPQDNGTPTTAGSISSRTQSPQTAIPAQNQSTMSAPLNGGQPAMPAAHGGASPASLVSPERPSPLSSGGNSDYMRHPNAPSAAAFRPPHEMPSPFFSNSNGIFRPGFPTSYTPPAHMHPAVMQQHSPIPSQMQNGPTDLSMKKPSSSSKNQLNPTEIATIKQLIAGYRESAAFLYRSADELEQLLLQQN